MNVRKVIGKRNESKLTQEEMAKKLGISLRSYSNKENGKTDFTASELIKISEITKTPISYFFED
jgi:putative transcriptional regulator